MLLCSHDFQDNQLQLMFDVNFKKIKIQKLESRTLLNIDAEYEVITMSFNKLKNDIVINISAETNIVGLIFENDLGIYTCFLTRNTNTNTHIKEHNDNFNIIKYLKNENIYATFRKKEYGNK